VSSKKAPSSEPAPPPAAAPTSAVAPPASRWEQAQLSLLVFASVVSLAFYAGLPGRLPTDADYDKVAETIRSGFAAGDAVANAPEWAEKARQKVHGLRFIEPPDLLHADLSDVHRLWLIGLPDAPRSDATKVADQLGTQLTRDGEMQRFGELTLQRYVNPAFREPLYSFTQELGRAEVSIQLGPQHIDCSRNVDEFRCQRGGTVAREVREIDFAPYECVGANAVGRAELVVEYPSAVLGKELDVLAGVTGEMGWKHTPEYTAVKLTIDVDGQRLGVIDIPPGTVPPQKLTIDTSSLPSDAPHRVRFAVTSDNPKEREFCFDARSY
jgi:hypothetical protein